ncbi:hypothetical protein CK203_109268 [Vitis vinifera]|uniref:Uncharacterized protein n=1 Tax=Vitis vinifera TaxID=29760 RepID=A0A438DAE9_VITVI|nr:hypothetical protein CK203_109268 [Vitis vinifera]
MPKTRGGHTSAPQSSERAAPVRAPLDAPPHLADSALRADTIRGEHLPHLWPLLRFHLGVLLQRKPRLQSQESPLEHLGIHSLSLLPPGPRPSSPIEGNSDCRSKAFHVEAYFDHTILRQQTDLRDSYSLLERYHLVPFMTPPQFFYPRVVLDFYQSMTTRGVPVPASILFTIDGRQGILGLDRLPRLSISLMHQLIPLHLDAGPHFLSGTWFVAYLEDIFPEDHFQEGASPRDAPS